MLDEQEPAGQGYQAGNNWDPVSACWLEDGVLSRVVVEHPDNTKKRGPVADTSSRKLTVILHVHVGGPLQGRERVFVGVVGGAVGRSLERQAKLP